MKFLVVILLLACVGVQAYVDEGRRWNPSHAGRAAGLLQAEPAAEEEFSYDREEPRGPLNWGLVDANCLRSAQSPIDVVTANVQFDATLYQLNTVYRDLPVGTVVINTGESIRVEINDTVPHTLTGGALPVGVTYELINFHAHTPSDHTINGASYPLELHLVHARTPAVVDTDPTQLTVISILFQEGASSPLLSRVGAAVRLILNKTATVPLNVTLPLSTLIPAADRFYYTYPGSLTTPNCRETVTWHVLRTPQTASGLQLQEFRQAFGFIATNRPTQLLGSRTVRTNSPIPVTPAVRNATGNAATTSASTSPLIALTVFVAWAVGRLAF